MKRLAFLCAALATSPAAAFPLGPGCSLFDVIGGSRDLAANVRSRPTLQSPVLWQLRSIYASNPRGSLRWCGDSELNRSEGIDWLWMSFEMPGEPWDHEGWIARSMVAPTASPPAVATPAPVPVTPRAGAG